MGFLLGEIAKRRGHRPIRQLIAAAGEMVQRIKPVFLMSPITVAQFLPPGAIGFDLLVIDEASQIRPEDALGAAARARQIVVVGDQKQLPPTSFFDRLAEDLPEDDPEEIAPAAEASAAPAAPRAALAGEMESILTLCAARGLPDRMLEWHYRSRDPSLIAVSNAEFYDSRLILPPSPLQRDPEFGLRFVRVDGVYSSRSRGGGRPGTNRIEAEAVVARLAAQARTRPDASVGVVAFSKAQSDLLTELLEAARRRDPVLDAFLREGKTEDVFVKNIESVQGDERDTILISVGYGPHEAGGRLTAMQFGPINAEGGERRLNVVFTRARARCRVFASFDPDDIDLARAAGEGPRILKRFLEFARSGRLDQASPTGGGAESPFEADVAREIAALGYRADAQVGSAGFRVDLGVRHPERPGRYILAVECDGAAWHGALWARERDRLRQDVLEGLGWRFHRIWSTDWFHARAREIARLREALALRREQHAHGRGRVERLDRPHRVEDGLARHDHSWTSAERAVVDLAVPVRRVLAHVVHVARERARLDRVRRDARPEESREEAGEDGEHVDPHGSSATLSRSGAARRQGAATRTLRPSCPASDRCRSSRAGSPRSRRAARRPRASTSRARRGTGTAGRACRPGCTTRGSR